MEYVIANKCITLFLIAGRAINKHASPVQLGVGGFIQKGQKMNSQKEGARQRSREFSFPEATNSEDARLLNANKP